MRLKERVELDLPGHKSPSLELNTAMRLGEQAKVNRLGDEGRVMHQATSPLALSSISL